ncbi:MAG: HEPN domain-containing protein [Caldilineales bacterium]|nr:HEPN domain-containing protein [Caldilineales bacterium]
MPPEPDLGTPSEWLRRAQSNLIRAQQPKPEGVYWEDLCFDAQQAAEKAIKALLIFYGIPFRFVHDLTELLTRLEQGGVHLPKDVRSAAALSNYAVEARYPGPTEPVTEEEYQEAVALAEVVVRWVERLVKAELREGE